MAHNILVVDDEEGIRKYVAKELTRQGFTVVTADGGRKAIEELHKRSFDAVLCDLLMPEVDGLDVLRSTRDLKPRPPFIVFTAYGSVSVAVEAMKHGAVDFLEKPVPAEELHAVLLSHISRTEERESELVGSPTWLDPFRALLRQVSRSKSNILIEGETGTGKSAVAREIWHASPRAGASFVSYNCATIQETLAESELFGHKKGAYTGADQDREGLVKDAEGGTLFLDEIGELKPSVQAKLLTFLQDRIYRPLGSDQDCQGDVRVIVATNRDLAVEVEKGTFRSDLYYRLAVVNLRIPPLRERSEDIPLLVEHFRRRSAEKNEVDAPEFSSEVLQAMAEYDWKGNVRELENFVEKMTVMYPGSVINVAQLDDRIRRAAGLNAVRTTSSPGPAPAPARAADSAQALPDELERIKRERIIHALELCGWNKKKAADMLGMKRTTLVETMKRLGIETPAHLRPTIPQA